MSERKLVPAAVNDINVLYTKLRPLKDAENEKGFYVELPIGDSLSGVLKGSEVDNYGKTAFSIERADGKTQVISSAGNLGRQMAEVTAGTYVQITYQGKKEMKSGPYAGTPSHQFSVLKEEI